MSALHILACGQAICGAGFPTDWKDDAKWIGIDEAKIFKVEGIPTNLEGSLCAKCVSALERGESRNAPGDRVSGHILIGADHREVVMNFGGELKRDGDGNFFIAFSPSQARALGRLLNEKAKEAEEI